jgi:hypothetical protein
MSWQDRLIGGVSDAFGGALNLVGQIAAESFEKATRTRTGNALPENADGQQNLPDGLPDPTDEAAKALMVDPFSVIDQLGYKDRPSGLTYWTLEEMVRRVPVVTAIHQTRTEQVANFAIPQQNDRDPGFRVKLRDKTKNTTKAERKRAREIEDWLMWTGSTRKFGKDSFETFLQKIVRDSLTYDQASFEVVDNRKGEPSDFYAVDAATIRIADVPLGADLDDDPNRARFVQIYDEVVIAEFAAHELCLGIRNPRTGIRLNGYGYSEMEMMINVVTALLWTFEYNKRFFSQGSAPKGILNFRGSIPDKKLDAFRRQWYQLISGVANAWRTPVVNSEEIQHINLHTSNRDMEFSAWNDFLIKICSAIYLFDPAEIGFIYGNTGQTTQMFQAPAEQRIKHSKDRGLRPLLRKTASWVNHYLVWRIEEDFEVEFTGLDSKSSDQIADLQKKQVTYLKTVDEIRAEDDMDPLPDGKGEVILDPTWLQFAQAKDMEAQQEEGGFDMAEEPEAEEEQQPADDIREAMESMPETSLDKREQSEKSFRKSAFVTESRADGIITYTIEV